MATWQTITYYEAHPGSPNEQYATDASRVLRTLYFPGRPTVAERQKIAQQWIGYARVFTDLLTNKKYVSRVTPHFYPVRDFGQQPHLYCQSLVGSEMVELSGNEATALHAAGDVTPLAEFWKATFEYRTLPYDVKEDADVQATAGDLFVAIGPSTYPDEGDALRRGWVNTRCVAKVVEPGGRVIPLRHGVLKFAGTGVPGGVPTMEPFPYNETLQNLTYFWSGVPLDGYPTVAVQQQLNTVNDDAFDGYNRDTLLLLDARATPRRDPFGQRTVDVTYRMLWAPRYNPALGWLGHNAMLYVTGGGVKWMVASVDGTALAASLPYRRTDFSKLFHPDQPP